MPRDQLANGAATSSRQQRQRRHRPSKASIRTQVTAPPLLRLPTDVWLHIFVQLHPHAASTLAALSTSCSHLLRLVDEYGWKTVVQTEYSNVNLDRLDTFYRAYASRCDKAAVRSRWWFAGRYASLLEGCWSQVTLRPASVDVPAAERSRAANGTANGRARRFGTDFAIPTLTLGTRWIVVGARSHLFVYHARPVEAAKQGDLVARIKLDSRGLTAEPVISCDNTATTKGKGSAADDPWQDITALKALDSHASVVVVGYADGCVQVVALRSKGPKGKEGVEAEVLQQFPSSRRQEVAGLSVHHCQVLDSSGAPNSTLAKAINGRTPSNGSLIASITKRGRLRIHSIPSSDGPESERESCWQIDSEGKAAALSDIVAPATNDTSGANTPPRSNFRSAAFNNAPVVAVQDGAASASGSATRAWSVLLGSCSDEPQMGVTWVAVGITAEHAVCIYPLHPSDNSTGFSLQEPFHVASTGQRTSVYAMATPPPESTLPGFLLFVGFYDGVVRVYDTRQLQSADGAGLMDMNGLDEALSPSQPRRIRRPRVNRQLDPIAIFREDYDTDAIYSLSFGGPHATLLVVGGARHAKVRVFDVGMLAGY